MHFTPYDESSSHQFDAATRKRLQELGDKYGRVELKTISDDSYCVRISAEIKGLVVPMAAIGPSVHDAADRLLRVMSRPHAE